MFMNRGDRSWVKIEQVIQRRDRVLTCCYLAGLALAGACLFLPYRLSQLGAGLLVIALVHMLSKLYLAHSSASPGPDGGKAHPRLALADSILFNVPFLVAVNLVFMGLPLSQDPVTKATWDCWFLGSTVMLLTMSYCWNRRAVRALAICVGSKAIESSRSE